MLPDLPYIVIIISRYPDVSISLFPINDEHVFQKYNKHMKSFGFFALRRNILP